MVVGGELCGELDLYAAGLGFGGGELSAKSAL
jgi:hypothetical protein